MQRPFTLRHPFAKGSTLEIAKDFNGKLENCEGLGFGAVKTHKIKHNFKYMVQLSNDIKTAVL